MEIRPATLDDITAGRDGRQYLVTAEAGNIAARLQEIDPRVFVEFHEPPPGRGANAYYSVCMHRENARDDLIFRVRSEDFDPRVVERLRMLNFNQRHGISEADRMDAEDDTRKRASTYALEQAVGAGAEKLMRSMQRSILGINPRVYMHRSRQERRLGTA